MQRKPRYLIYPTLLDKFQRVLDAEEEFNGFFNEDADGGYKQTLEEIVAKREQELLDAINRVPHEPIEAADKGTCFNEIVDCALLGKRSTRDDVQLKSVWDPSDDTEAWRPATLARIEASMEGFFFMYEGQTCLDAINYFKGAIPQYRCSGRIMTEYGLVELYGYVDYIRQNVVYDMKTTGSYTFGNYEKYWQRYLYPYCLIQSGDMTEVQEFEFSVYELTGGSSRTPLIGAKFYRERYDYNHQVAEQKLKDICEQFIAWVKAHRRKIKNKRLFNK